MGEEPRKFWTRPKISSQKEILDDNGVPNKQTFASGSNKPTGQTITMEKLFTCFQSKCPKGISTLQSLLFGEIQMDFFKSPDPTFHFFPFFLYWSFLRVWRCYGVSHAFQCGRVTSMASRDRKRSITNEVSEITARWSGPLYTWLLPIASTRLEVLRDVEFVTGRLSFFLFVVWKHNKYWRHR